MRKVALLLSILASALVLTSCSSCCGSTPVVTPCPAKAECLPPHHDYKGEVCK